MTKSETKTVEHLWLWNVWRPPTFHSGNNWRVEPILALSNLLLFVESLFNVGQPWQLLYFVWSCLSAVQYLNCLMCFRPITDNHNTNKQNMEASVDFCSLRKKDLKSYHLINWSINQSTGSYSTKNSIFYDISFYETTNIVFYF